MLTAIYPALDGLKWHSAAKDHVQRDHLDLTVYAVAIPGRLRPKS